MNNTTKAEEIYAMVQRREYRAALDVLLPLELTGRGQKELLKLRAELAADYSVKEVVVHDLQLLAKYKDLKTDVRRIELLLYLNLRDYQSAQQALKSLPPVVRGSDVFATLVVRFFYETGNYRRVDSHCQSSPTSKLNTKMQDYWINACVASGNVQKALELCGRQRVQSPQKSRLKQSLTTLTERPGNTLQKADSQTVKVGIITPVGPGHEETLKLCQQSIESVCCQLEYGRFELNHIVVDDSQAKLGRSKARNIGIQKAIDSKQDWLFFLDADDLLDENLLAYAAPYLASCDFLWGGIYSGSRGGPYHYRLNQLPCITSIEDLLEESPFLTLQMGHFARVDIVEKHGLHFDETMDCGEDVKFYLHEASVGRILKIPQPFFYNIRGEHSIGPRSASGGEWNRATRQVINSFKANR